MIKSTSGDCVNCRHFVQHYTKYNKQFNKCDSGECLIKKEIVTELKPYCFDFEKSYILTEKQKEQVLLNTLVEINKNLQILSCFLVNEQAIADKIIKEK